MHATSPSATSLSAVDDLLIRAILRMIGDPPLQIFLESSNSGGPIADGRPAVRIGDRATLIRLLLDPDTAFGDAFTDGRLQVEGDLVSFLEVIYRFVRDGPSRGWLSSLVSRWLYRLQANSLRGSRRNITKHYDLGTEVYSPWLDRELQYSCAYFPEPDLSLEGAQAAKMDYVCRKLGLRSGETVVEAGCGWGALALYMASQYGVTVKAFNISRDQVAHARARAAREGLLGQVEFIEDDYRNIRQRADVFLSVGMLEHVGPEHYPELAKVIHRVIGSLGRGLLHFIGRNRPYPLSTWIRRRVFPGAQPPTLRQAIELLEAPDYSVLDVENLRAHYAKTLEHWLARFECASATGRVPLDERFRRTWRLYLAGSLVAFRVGTLQLFQVLFAGRDCIRIPWSRESLYAGGRSGRIDQWHHSMS